MGQIKQSSFISIGKVVGVHGVKGILKIVTNQESISLLKPGTPIFISRNQHKDSCISDTYIIETVKPYKGNTVLLSFNDIKDRNLAECFVGSEISIEKSRLPEIEEDSYFWNDLIGLNVFSREGENLGQIEYIIPTGSNDVYVVTKPDEGKKREILIPAIKSIIEIIDLNSKRMQVNLPEGLIDT